MNRKVMPLNLTWSGHKCIIMDISGFLFCAEPCITAIPRVARATRLYRTAKLSAIPQLHRHFQRN